MGFEIYKPISDSTALKKQEIEFKYGLKDVAPLDKGFVEIIMNCFK